MNTSKKSSKRVPFSFRLGQQQYVVLFFAFLYLIFSAKEVMFGDDLSFTLNAIEGYDWASNATNHLLYVNLLALLHNLFSFIPPHSLFVAVSVASAIVCLRLLQEMLELIGGNKRLNLALVLIFGFSFTFWRHAEIVEVYTLNLCLNAVVLWCFIRWIKVPTDAKLMVASFVLGVAFLVHIQNSLLLPFMLWWWYAAGARLKLLGKMLLFGAPCFLLFVPLAFDLNSFESIFFDNSFSDEVTDISVGLFFKGMAKGLGFLVFNFSVFGLLMILSFFQKGWNKRFRNGLMVFALSVFVFAARYNVSDNYVFFLPAYLAMILLLANYLRDLAVHRLFHTALIITALAQPFLYLFVLKAARSFQIAEEVDKQKAYKGGLSFYLWPGMLSKDGVVQMKKAVDNGQLSLDQDPELERNYLKVNRYLKLTQAAEN